MSARFAAWSLAVAFGVSTADAQQITSIQPTPRLGLARAVVVEDVPQVHTAQILPLDTGDRVASPGDVAAQSVRVVELLAEVLAGSGSDLGRLVRVNVHATDRDHFPVVQKTLAAKLAGMPTLPAVTWSVTPLPKAGALVALDAVAAATPATADAAPRIRIDGVPAMSGPTHGAILPPGTAVYISGMVGQGDMAAATRSALEQLAGVMSGLGLSLDDVVHVRTFLQPMSDAEASTSAIVAFFAGQEPPPITHFAWTLGDPIEIELVVAGEGVSLPAEESGAVQYYTPPDVEASRVFARVAVCRGGPRIYTGSVVARAAGDVPGEVRGMFDELETLLQAAGSDLEHMVKATYFVRDDAASEALTRVRGEIYNPQRPPAASKAGVEDTGFDGRSVVLDMIAVPRP